MMMIEYIKVGVFGTHCKIALNLLEEAQKMGWWKYERLVACNISDGGLYFTELWQPW